MQKSVVPQGATPGIECSTTISYMFVPARRAWRRWGRDPMLPPSPLIGRRESSSDRGWRRMDECFRFARLGYYASREISRQEPLNARSSLRSTSDDGLGTLSRLSRPLCFVRASCFFSSFVNPRRKVINVYERTQNRRPNFLGPGCIHHGGYDIYF